MFVGMRSYHPLDWETGIHVIGIGTHVYGFEMIKERRPLVPRHVLGSLHDVVTLQRADRKEGQFSDIVETRGKIAEFLENLVVWILIVVHEIHLVNADGDMLDPEKIGNESMPLGLLDHSLTGIDQDEG